jgi:hypothetical protein
MKTVLKNRYLTLLAVLFLAYIARDPSTQQVFILAIMLVIDALFFLFNEYKGMRQQSDLDIQFAKELKEMRELRSAHMEMNNRLSGLELMSKSVGFNSLMRK